jgi:hypothetical protein
MEHRKKIRNMLKANQDIMYSSYDVTERHCTSVVSFSKNYNPSIIMRKYQAQTEEYSRKHETRKQQKVPREDGEALLGWRRLRQN